MRLKDLSLKISYRSKGPNNIIDELLIPGLKCSKIYKRSVGYFSSGVFELIGNGLKELAERNGEIRLICNPELSNEDIEGIRLGYHLKENVIRHKVEADLEEALKRIDDWNLKLLIQLIGSGRMNVLVVDMEDECGIYHDKIGLLIDDDENKVLFVGSPNESVGGYRNNYEKIRVSMSWKEGDYERIQDDEEEFDDIWDGRNEYITRIDYTELVLTRLETEKKRRGLEETPKGGVKLREYQKAAINAWEDNGYHGFYVMATGTGKTWTAIYSALKVMEQETILLVICAPYKHLVRQWYEDVHNVLPDNRTIMVTGENHNWEDEFLDAIYNSKYNGGGTIIAISTIVSFNMAKFRRIVDKSKLKKMLIVDEAHRFKNRDSSLKEIYSYMLGLSATPSSKRNDEFGRELMDFFGGQVYNLPIEYAIEQHYLAHYNYYPIFVNATEQEEKEFDKYSRLMASCFRNGKCFDVESLARHKRSRLRVISMAEEKISRLKWILSQVREEEHFIVYCGDGRLFDNNSGEEIRHIQYVKEVLHEMGYKSSQFTAQEDMKTRMQLVDAFNRGYIDAMVAIRCLDEGINIPSIKGALILSSNDDYREFVQRRGRILRNYTNEMTGEKKQSADIYDVIVLPSDHMKNFALIELRRFYEYLRLADNSGDCMGMLEELRVQYGIEQEELMELDENEGDLDE